ncbi:MAG: hypothetical protein M3135_07265 [Actinomycetota bacterium]|nr:hypothetical protein [Actinomycetota bacterium]
MLIPLLWTVAIVSAALSFLIWALLVRSPQRPSTDGEETGEGGSADEEIEELETETGDIAEERDDRDIAT